jgi:hypothetical protein
VAKVHWYQGRICRKVELSKSTLRILTAPKVILISFWSTLVAVLFGFEVARMVFLGILLMFSLASQLQTAFDFQVDIFQKSMRNRLSQISLRHFQKYREIIIVRGTFKPILSLGPVAFLLIIVPLILFLNYSIVKMYHDLSAPALLTLIYFTLISMLFVKTVFDEGAALEQTSVQLLKRFQIQTKELHGRDLRYVTRAIRSLPVFSLYLGLPGWDIIQIHYSSTASAFLFILDNTLNLLLTF